MSNKKLVLAFIPIFLLAGMALFIRIVQYEPLTPNANENEEEQLLEQVPIFTEDPITGNKKAKVTLIAFEDFACSNCKVQSDLLLAVLTQYPQSVKIVWKILPITRYPVDSTLSAQYAFCAHAQNKFEEFKEYAFQNSTNLSESVLQSIAQELTLDETKLTSCLASPLPQTYIDKTKSLAGQLNIQALPTMFINNKQIIPPTTVEGWKKLLEI